MMKHDLQLSSDIFSLQAVEAAVRAYSGLACIQVESRPGGWLLSFTDCRYDPRLTIREFNNYLINLASISL